MHVLPLLSGVTAGVDGAVTLIDAGDRTVAWLESQGPGVLVENTAEVRRFGALWDVVLGASLPLDISADMIGAIAHEIEG